MSPRYSLSCVAGVLALIASAGAMAAARVTESYQQLPLPPGFKVMVNELEGPVYTDTTGKTLYTWPFRAQRVGATGDQVGKSSCTFEKRTESDGLFEPYPGGFVLPDVDKRHSCAEEWPPVLAGDDAKTVGAWSVITRGDGKKQWAYEGYPLYTYIADRKPGDVIGGSRGGGRGGFSGPGRVAMGPPPLVPPTFSVLSTVNGRLLATNKGVSVYASDRDRPGKSNCDEKCLQDWKPLIAPLFAKTEGEWSIFERATGVMQWAYRGRPLYTNVEDGENVRANVAGSDRPGWHNVYTQQVAPRPSDFTLEDTAAGQVLADKRGHTVYSYNCTEDAVDQFACNRPDSPQQYRLAVCGGGNVDRCLKLFPYVAVSAAAKNESTLWTPVLINLRTGHEAGPGDKDAQAVWAYHGQPVFTYAGDREPGTIKADGWGEFQGSHNGFSAFMVRDEFARNAP
jgi:predicted lipoprotein with Yx(FWY)xxD motif